MATCRYMPLADNVEEMFIGPFGSSLKNDAFVPKDEAFCMVYEQKHAIKKTMDVETRYVDSAKYNELKRFNIKGGDIIVSCRGTIGETYIVPDDAPLGIMHPSIMKIRLKPDIYNKRYFNLLLCDYLRKHEEEANGSGIKMVISAKELGAAPFPVPEMEEQNHVATIFDEVDTLIFLRKHQLVKLDELVKARFVELFGDYRINEKGFDCKQGSELFKFSSGKFLPEERRLDKGVPVYGGNGIAWYTSEYLVDYPTIIIGRVGAQCGNIHSVTTPVWITDNAIYIKEQKTEAYTLEFLTELMQMMDFYQYADFSGQPKITQKPLETLDYIMPPIELQNEYTAFVEQVDKSKLAVQQSLDKLELLKKSLMQKYFG